MKIASLKRIVRTSRAGARLLDKWLTEAYIQHARIQVGREVDFYLAPDHAVAAVGELSLAKLPAKTRDAPKTRLASKKGTNHEAS